MNEINIIKSVFIFEKYLTIFTQYIEAKFNKNLK